MNAADSDSEIKSPTSLDEIQIGDKGQTIKLPTKNGKEKLGHRRVNTATGEVTYKKTSSSSISGAIQLGIAHSVGSLSKEPHRDILMQDFEFLEEVDFPSRGTTITPSHQHGDFRFQSIAPIGMRFFRDIFGISVESFLNSIAAEPLVEIGNPGASGSLFWVTHDDEFIIKTLQAKEADFLQRLLPGYYLNVQQNPRTLLPKFYGLYCVKMRGKHIRIVVMNNLLPRDVEMNWKYDLKGSTLKRTASSKERAKSSPTFKDLDFREHFPEGITLENDVYSALLKTLERDCTVLRSFKIMDYSFLMGIHVSDGKESGDTDSDKRPGSSRSSLQGSLVRKKNMKSFYKRNALYSTPTDMIFSGSSANLQQGFRVDMNWGGIPAKKVTGEPLVIYCGVIDILQCYKTLKKLEHRFKAIIYDGKTVSVHKPSYYSERFLKFLRSEVFRPAKSRPQLTIPPSIKEINDGSGDLPVDQPKKKPIDETDKGQVENSRQIKNKTEAANVQIAIKRDSSEEPQEQEDFF